MSRRSACVHACRESHAGRLPARLPPYPLSSAQESQQAGDDQVDGHDVVQQSRHDQDEDPCDQRDERSQGNVRHAGYRTGDRLVTI